MPADEIDSPLTPAEKGRAKFLEDFAELMSQPAFRRWLWHLIEDPGWCAANACSEDTKDVNATFLAAGKRRVGVLLNRTAMGVADEHYKRMLIEAINLKVQREMQQMMADREAARTAREQ